MDIYEALQSGASAEDLIKKFNTELMEAQKKIRDEQEQRQKRLREAEAAAHEKKIAGLEADLNDARAILAEQIVYYVDCYADYVTEGKYLESDKDAIISTEEVEKLLKEAEAAVGADIRTLMAIYNIGKLKKDNKDKNLNVKFKSTDTDIINDFIRGLK